MGMGEDMGNIQKLSDRFLINYKDIENNLINIFSDAIILDTHFNIVNVSSSILDMLGYNKADLMEEHISILLNNETQKFIESLNDGYFLHKEFSIKGNCGKELQVFFSCYFLGLVSDINGKIIILVKEKFILQENKRQLERNLMDLNELIYRTSHDISGPLATIKGLTLVAQHENELNNASTYFKLIKRYADRLDLNLQYLRESINKKNYQLQWILLAELISTIVDRIGNIEKIYDCEIEIIQRDTPGHQLFLTNMFLSSFLIENFLLITNSFREFKSDVYKIEISANRKQLEIKICNPCIVKSLDGFRNGLNFKEIRKLLSGSGYNYLNFKTFMMCQKIIKAETRIDENNKSTFVIVIPSQD